MGSGPLSIGSVGNLIGRQYTVAGYAVIGMYEDGELYTWTEYALEAEDGSEATLELDEGQWKFMEDYSPKQPLTAIELANAFAGSTLRLDGTTLRVTQAESAVLTACEGKNDLAFPKETRWRYLDAVSTGRIWAAEWVGSRVCWVRGVYLSNDQVSKAFGIKEISLGGAIDAVFEMPEEKKRAFWHSGLVLLLCALLALALGVFRGDNPVKIEAARLTSQSAGPLSGNVVFGPIDVDPSRNGYKLEVFSDGTELNETVSGKLSMERPAKELQTAESASSWVSSSKLATEGYTRVKNKAPHFVILDVAAHKPGAAVGYKLTSDCRSGGWLFAYGILGLMTGAVLTAVGLARR